LSSCILEEGGDSGEAQIAVSKENLVWVKKLRRYKRVLFSYRIKIKLTIPHSGSVYLGYIPIYVYMFIV